MSRDEEKLEHIQNMMHLGWQWSEKAKNTETNLRLYPSFYSDAEREQEEKKVDRCMSMSRFYYRMGRVANEAWFPRLNG